jgi:hypothetical protein
LSIVRDCLFNIFTDTLHIWRPSPPSAKSVKIRIYKTIILPVVLYGCETWSLTLRGEHGLRVFENRVLRRIFRSKRDEVREVGENYIMRSFITYTFLQV